MLNKIISNTVVRAVKWFRDHSATSPRLRRQSPIVRRIVVHVGMPKAGSTSIQSALQAAQEGELTANGIWFTPLGSAFNDCVLYDMLVAGDLAGIDAYAHAKAEAAKAAGADIMIISAERLYTIDKMEERMAQLGAVFAKLADEVTFVVVVREIRSFLRSYVTQMIYNGSITVENFSLAEWVVDQAASIAACGFPVHFISLEQENGGRNIAETLVSVSTGRDIEMRLDRANITPSRPLMYALSEGLAARLYALETGDDVNSVFLDQFRSALARDFDSLMRGAKDAAEVFNIVHGFDAILKSRIDLYINRCLEKCNQEKLLYFNNLGKIERLVGETDLPRLVKAA